MSQNNVIEERLARFKANAEAKGVQTTYDDEDQSSDAKKRLERFKARAEGKTVKEILKGSDKKEDTTTTPTATNMHAVDAAGTMTDLLRRRSPVQATTPTTPTTPTTTPTTPTTTPTTTTTAQTTETNTEPVVQRGYAPHDIVNPVRAYDAVGVGRVYTAPTATWSERQEIENVAGEAYVRELDKQMESVREKQKNTQAYIAKREDEIERIGNVSHGDMFDWITKNLGGKMYATADALYPGLTDAEAKQKAQEEIDAAKGELYQIDEEVKRLELVKKAYLDPMFNAYVTRGQEKTNPRLEESDNTLISLYGLQDDMNYDEGYESGNYWFFLTPDELAIHNYYLGKYGEEAANKYLDAMESTARQRMDAYEQGKAAEFSEEHAVTGSILSVAARLGSVGEYVTDTAKTVFGDPYSPAERNQYAYLANAYRSGAAKAVSFEIADWDVGAFLYNTAMSGVDSLITAPVPGGVIVLGLSAAADATNDALDRGLSKEQAFWAGLASGTFEGLFESVSIGNLKSLKMVDVKNGRDIAKNIAKSMLVNASEETCTEIANILYDTMAHGELANYTLEELKSFDKDTWNEIFARIGVSAASGGLMGLGFGGIGTGVSAVNNRASNATVPDVGTKPDASDDIASVMPEPENQQANTATEEAPLYDVNDPEWQAYLESVRKNEESQSESENAPGEERVTPEKYAEMLAKVEAEEAAARGEAAPERADDIASVMPEPELESQNANQPKKATADTESKTNTPESIEERIRKADERLKKQLSESIESDTKIESDGFNVRDALFNTAESDSAATGTVSNEVDAAVTAELERAARENGVEVEGDLPGQSPEARADLISDINNQTNEAVIQAQQAYNGDTTRVANVPEGMFDNGNTPSLFDAGTAQAESVTDNGYTPDLWDDAEATRDASVTDDGYTPDLWDDSSFTVDGDSPLTDAEQASLTEEIRNEDKRRKSDKPEQAREKASESQSGNTSSAADIKINTPMDEYTRTGKYTPDTPQNVSRKRRAQAAKTDTAKTGRLAGASDLQIYIAEQLSKYTGRRILFYSKDYSIAGEYDGDNTIFVNPARGNIVSQIIAHELTHTVEGSKHYGPLVKSIKSFLDTYSKNGTYADWDTYRADVYAEYEAKYKDITGTEFDDAKADYETVARFMEELFGEKGLTTERQVEFVEFVKQNRNAVSRMWYRLAQLAKRIRQDIGHGVLKKIYGKDYDVSYRENQLMLRQLEDIRDRFGRALVQTKRGSKASGNGVQYMLADLPNTDEKFVIVQRESIAKLLQFPGDSLSAKVRSYLKQYRGTVLPVGDEKGAYMRREAEGEYTNPAKSVSDSDYENKLKAASEFENLLLSAKYSRHEDDNGRHPDATRGWDYYELKYLVPISSTEVRVYSAEIQMKLIDRGDCFYDITKIEDITNGTAGQAIITAAGSVYDIFNNSISQNPDSVNSEFSFSDADTKPRNELEEENRQIAINEYTALRRQQRAQASGRVENTLSEERIYQETGWYFDDRGRFVVDHNAPVYTKGKTDDQRARDYVQYAHEHAESAEAESAQVKAENAALREDAAKWQKRAEAAEEASRILEEKVKALESKSSKELSPEYMPSKKQVKGIIKELCDGFGGGFTAKQISDFTNRLMEIYDSIFAKSGTAVDLTDYSSEIAELITDMQDVRLKNEDNEYMSGRLASELKGVPLYLSQKARGDISGGYGKAMRDYQGKVNLTTKERGTPVEVRYMELSTLYPDWFSPEITNEAEQLQRMFEVSDMIRAPGFTTRDRYADVGADADTVRKSDFSEAMMRIVEGFNEVEQVPRTFADKVMRQLEIERRDHKREIDQKAQEEAVLREAVEALEWELKNIAQAEAAKAQRAHDRGADISGAKIKAARDDRSFTKKMTELYDRRNQLEDEIALIQAVCRRWEHVDSESLRDSAEKQYINDIRARRDALIEKKSNLDAYINKVNSHVKEIDVQTIVGIIRSDGGLGAWKNKSALTYATNTMRRNIASSAPEGSKFAKYMIEQILDPITTATYMTTLVRNEVRTRVKALGLELKPRKGDKLSESQFVQAYAEAVDNLKALENEEGSFIYNKRGEPMREGMTAEEWRGYLNRIISENRGITGDAARFEHMKEAAKVFTEIYDMLFTTINAARVRNGYAPVPYHRGYFPHYGSDTKQDGVFSRMLQGFGFRQEQLSENLPTSIIGLTSTFRPGIRYMSNAKQRSLAGLEGERRVTGAVEGLDRYIEVATDVAFQTDNIQKLRALSKAIRYSTTSEATKADVEAIRNNDELSYEQKQAQIDGVLGAGKNARYKLGNFVANLDEYTNQLAGKKSKWDRESEALFGRALYTMMKNFTGRVAANTIVRNLGSALTNVIPLLDGGATMNRHMLGAVWDMFKGHVVGDGFVSTSEFLTNRRGSQRLIRSFRDVSSDSGVAAMNIIDNLTSELLMRARVRQNMSKSRGSMSFDAAVKEADTFIAGMMGDRSKGALPTIFGSMNPIVKQLTMYQVEVANQFGFMFKDLKGDSGTAKWIAKLAIMMLLHSLFNDWYEKLVGRRPAFDPLDMLNDLAGDLTGYKFESLYELHNGDGDIIKKVDKKNPVAAVWDTAVRAAQETPFVGGVLGGGRVPIANASIDTASLKTLLESAAGDGEKGENGWKKGIELGYKAGKNILYNLAFPHSGGQVKRTVEGVDAMLKGGSYKYDSEGNRLLQYPVFTDEGTASTVGTWAKSILFGKNSTATGQEWVEGGFGYLSAKQTAAYEGMVSAGEGQRESWELIQTLRDTNPDEGKTLARLEVIMESDVIDEAKAIAFETFVSTAEKWPKQLKQLMAAGVDLDSFFKIHSLSLAGMNQDELIPEIDALDLTSEQKDLIYLCYWKESKLEEKAPW